MQRVCMSGGEEENISGRGNKKITRLRKKYAENSKLTSRERDLVRTERKFDGGLRRP